MIVSMAHVLEVKILATIGIVGKVYSDGLGSVLNAYCSAQTGLGGEYEPGMSL